MLQYIDKDNFECPELGVVQKCPMILGEHQSPGGKFFGKQNFEKNLFLNQKRVFLVFFYIEIVTAVSKTLKNPGNV